jgi:hypothetical protein
VWLHFTAKDAKDAKSKQRMQKAGRTANVRAQRFERPLSVNA